MQHPSSRPARRWPALSDRVTRFFILLRNPKALSVCLGIVMLLIVLSAWTSFSVILHAHSPLLLITLLSVNLIIGVVISSAFTYFQASSHSPRLSFGTRAIPTQPHSPQALRNISVMFVDMSNFCELVQHLQPAQQMALLHEIYSNFDRIISNHCIQRIKTNGDEYIAASPPIETHCRSSNKHHVSTIAISKAALEIRDYFNQTTRQHAHICRLRIGISTGDVITGCIGILSPCTDMWGKPMLVASRLEDNCIPNQILICPNTYERVKRALDTEYVGIMDLKGLGRTPVHRLLTY